MKKFLSLLACGAMFAGFASTSHAQVNIDKIVMGNGSGNTLTLQGSGFGGSSVINIPYPGTSPANVILSQMTGGQTITGGLTSTGTLTLGATPSTVGTLVIFDNAGTSADVTYDGTNFSLGGGLAITGTISGATGITSGGTIDFTALSTDGVLHATGANGTLTSTLIVNADVATGAAIAGTKIDPNFGGQTVTTTGPVDGGTGVFTTSVTSPLFTDGAAMSIDPSSIATSPGNALTLDGGASSGATSTGGAVNIDGGTGTSAYGDVNVGTNSGIVNIGKSGGTTDLNGTVNINGASVVNGSGTTGTIPKWTAGSTLGNSLLTDNGTTLSYSGTNINSATDYQIGGTSVLSGTTLGSTIVNSSLTSVGTLTNLTVTNPIAGSITGNAATATTATTASNVATTAVSTGTIYPTFVAANTSSTSTPVDVATGISYVPSTGTLTATQFSGGGAGLTGVAASSIAYTGITSVPIVSLLGNATGVTANAEAITLGTGLSFSGTTLTNTGVTSLAGTANQITASASTGAVTLSLPATVDLGTVSSTAGTLTLADAGSSFSGTIQTATPLTANQTYTLPLTGGTLATTADLGSYLALSGGTMTGDITIGTHNVTGTTGTFTGGSLVLNGATSGSATIQAAAAAGSSTYTIPDAGAAANFILSTSTGGQSITTSSTTASVLTVNNTTSSGSALDVTNSSTGLGLNVDNSSTTSTADAADITSASTASSNGAGLAIAMSSTAAATGPGLKLSNGHLDATQAALPTASDPGAGNINTFTVAGTDVAGEISFSASTTAPTAADIVQVTFSKNYGTAPFVVLTPANLATSLIFAGSGYYVTPSTTNFQIQFNTGWTGAITTTYAFYYHVIE